MFDAHCDIVPKPYLANRIPENLFFSGGHREIVPGILLEAESFRGTTAPEMEMDTQREVPFLHDQ